VIGPPHDRWIEAITAVVVPSQPVELITSAAEPLPAQGFRRL
jgi:hypothetical protein